MHTDIFVLSLLTQQRHLGATCETAWLVLNSSRGSGSVSSEEDWTWTESEMFLWWINTDLIRHRGVMLSAWATATRHTAQPCQKKLEMPSSSIFRKKNKTKPEGLGSFTEGVNVESRSNYLTLFRENTAKSKSKKWMWNIKAFFFFKEIFTNKNLKHYITLHCLHYITSSKEIKFNVIFLDKLDIKWNKMK